MGKVPGGVSLLIWDETDQSQTFEVSVDIDILSLNEKIHEVFPAEAIQLETSKDVVMLSGKISSVLGRGKDPGDRQGFQSKSNQPDAVSPDAGEGNSARGEIRRG